MPIYHMSIKIGSRSAGKGAVAFSAYRAGKKYFDQETGKLRDFSKKKAVAYHEVFLPKNAPPEYADAEILWNEVQKVEKQANAQLYREFDIALPVELSLQENTECIREFCKCLCDEGMALQLNIHNKRGNPHAHIMCTTRGFKADGTWAAKERKGYLLDGNGNKIPVIDPVTGKQKVRERKGKGIEKIWERGVIESNDWNKKQKAEEWRSLWAQICNKHIDRHNAWIQDTVAHIDHRSFERQGIGRLPTLHEGYVARKIEDRGGVSELMEMNRQIRAGNRLYERKLSDYINAITILIQEIKSQVNEIGEKIRGLAERIRNTAKTGVGAAATGKQNGVLPERVGDDSYRKPSVAAKNRRTEEDAESVGKFSRRVTESSGQLEESRRELSQCCKEIERRSEPCELGEEWIIKTKHSDGEHDYAASTGEPESQEYNTGTVSQHEEIDEYDRQITDASWRLEESRRELSELCQKDERRIEQYGQREREAGSSERRINGTNRTATAEEQGTDKYMLSVEQQIQRIEQGIKSARSLKQKTISEKVEVSKRALPSKKRIKKRGR